MNIELKKDGQFYDLCLFGKLKKMPCNDGFRPVSFLLEVVE